MKRTEHSVLVVDDDPEILAMLSARLGHRGYKVSTAADGHEALDTARKERPDIVLLDVMMPGKSGWEVARALKQDPETSGIKIVIVSAMGGTTGITAPIVGADAHVDKPFEFDQIEKLITKLLA